ncbi:MAG: hypothetical protein FGM40_07995, partial [Rhodocyclaceae bacterium]|nr:hypothetical protein [Rhodocyclaceae bacterium]
MSAVSRLDSRLLRWLLLPLAGVLAVSVLADAWLSRKPVTDAFDQRLLVMALALAPQVTLEAGYPALRMPPEAEQVLRSIGGEDFRFGVFDSDGRRLVGAGGLPLLSQGASAKPRFFEATEGGTALRGVVLDQTVGGVQRVRIVVAVPRARLERRLEEAIAPGLTSDLILIILTLVLV